MGSDISHALMEQGAYYFRNAVRATGENREAYLDGLAEVIDRASVELGNDSVEVQQLVALQEEINLWQEMGKLPCRDSSGEG